MSIAGRQRSIRRLVLWGLAVGAIAAIGAFSLTGRLARSLPSPWYGRGSSLPRLPYRVVVGPVQAREGLPGLLSIGMTRKQVISNLGRPLVERVSIREAEREGFIDPEDVGSDFFGGVFAWVQYGPQDRVLSITFDMRAFAQKLGGEQRVLLSYRGVNYLLGADLSRNGLRLMFGAHGADSVSRSQGPDVVLDRTGTSFVFDAQGHLRSITIART